MARNATAGGVGQGRSQLYAIGIDTSNKAAFVLAR